MMPGAYRFEILKTTRASAQNGRFAPTGPFIFRLFFTGFLSSPLFFAPLRASAFAYICIVFFAKQKCKEHFSFPSLWEGWPFRERVKEPKSAKRVDKMSRLFIIILYLLWYTFETRNRPGAVVFSSAAVFRCLPAIRIADEVLSCRPFMKGKAVSVT